MALTRKHFIALAEAAHNLDYNCTRDDVIDALASVCWAHGQNFDPDRFREAARPATEDRVVTIKLIGVVKKDMPRDVKDWKWDDAIACEGVELIQHYPV